MITLQFSTKRLPFAWLVRKATWSPFSHVDFVLPDGRLLGARGMGGVDIREAEHYSRCERFQVKAPADVLHIAVNQVGRPYDWAGILGWGLHRDWQDQERWFCSELIAWAFQQAGHPLLRTPKVWRITPRDLLLSPHLVKV